MRAPHLLRGLAAAALLTAAVPAQETAIELPALFSTGMVLQRDADCAVWGTAEPFARVTVFGDWPDAVPAQVAADEHGAFRVEVATGAAGGPYHLIVASEERKTVVDDVWLGEVWLCSGQSNMEWSVARSAVGSATLAASDSTPADWDLPRIRMFHVPRRVSAAAQSDVDARWVRCTPENAQSFSAVALHFASVLQQELDVPIGLIGSYWGGTPAESWTSEATMERFAAHRGALERLRQVRAEEEATQKSLAAARQDWIADLSAVDPGIAGGWHEDADSDEGWTEIQVPGVWERAGIAELEQADGLVWFRRMVELPADWAGKELVLRLGAIDDLDLTYVDGHRVGATIERGKHATPRVYRVPASRVQGGETLICVRAIDTGGAGGFSSAAAELRIHPRGEAAAAIPLAGTWEYRLGVPVNRIPLLPGASPINAHTPTGLHNGMLAPLIPFRIAGAIWYQGESNRTRYVEYRTLFPAMIEDWRASWGYRFPFYFVQIAPFGYGNDTGQAGGLRDAQRGALQLRDTGMAVTMDIGNPADIHPRNKHEVGRRLALWAMAETYGRDDLVHSGPLPLSATQVGEEVVVVFHQTGGGLVAPDGLTSFELLGGDDRWHAASAVLGEDGVSVRVSAAAAPRAVAVRYAFGAADEAELFNAEGLPASSFRRTL